MRGLYRTTTTIVAILFMVISAPPQLPAQTTDPARGERARLAARFVDSIGINVHFSYRGTGYGETERVGVLLKRLGLRHLRDGVTADRPEVCAIDRALALKGFRFTFITQAHPTAAALRAWTSCSSPAVEAFEGINEYDISHPPSETQWAVTLQTSQRELYRAVKETPQLAALPVVAPSLTSENAFREVGDLSKSLDVGNIHNYFSFREPETNGWGLNGYGSLAYNMRLAREVAATKPIMSTETGYGTDRAANTVDAVTQAVYLPRLLLEQFSAGVVRTFPYELIDEGGDPFGHYGIVDEHLIPKPAFVALASLIDALQDDGGTFEAGVLHYILEGAGDNVHHLLLQKHDGRFLLALWLAVPSYDVLTHGPTAAGSQRVSVRVSDHVRQASIVLFGPDWHLHRTEISTKGPLSVTVSDRVTLLEIVPTAR